MNPHSYYELFAGGGMVRAGLGPEWSCLFANDHDVKKAATYRANWGEGAELHVAGIETVTPRDLPGRPGMVWGSFPCQDLSLAGVGAGLDGARSGTFYKLWELVAGLADEGRPPKLVVIENVCGALTSHEGRDFAAICEAFASNGYRYGALVIDAALFVPQSRPRLFIVGVQGDVAIPERLHAAGPSMPYQPAGLQRALAKVSDKAQQAALWWNLPVPPKRPVDLADVIEDRPAGVSWHAAAETDRLLAMMQPTHRAKIAAAQASGRRMVGGLYKRTRKDPLTRAKQQRAEVRFDAVAGCLRTPSGGSSRQTVIVVEGDKIRTRLLAPREAAALMGLAADYKLPAVYNEAYHLAGDGVVVPVVRHLAQHLFEPILDAAQALQSPTFITSSRP